MVEQKRCKKARGRRVPARRLAPAKARGADYSRVSRNYSGVPHEEPKNTQAIPEVALWRAVIFQAVWDITRKPRNRVDRYREDKVARMHTLCWLRSEDFNVVCEMAMLDPNVVAKAIERIRDETMLPPSHPQRRKQKRRNKHKTSPMDDLKEFLKVPRVPKPPGNLMCLPGVFVQLAFPFVERN